MSYVDVDDFVVFSNTTGIYQLPLTDDGHTYEPQLLPLGQGEINGVEYDSYTDQLYWIQTLQLPGSDLSTFSGSIRRGKFNGSDQVVLKDVTLINAPWFDMQLDYAGGHVFWTLEGGSQIDMVNTNGDGLASVLSHVNLRPQSLALNPEERYVNSNSHGHQYCGFYFASILYFVNWYGEPEFSSIRQLRLGSTETEIVYEESNNDDSTVRPVKHDSLFYDSDSRQLYWGDIKRQGVFRCLLPCTNVVTVLKTDTYSSLGMLMYNKHEGIFILNSCSLFH